MDKLEFTFTPEQNMELSVQATSIVDLLRPHLGSSPHSPQSPAYRLKGSIANTDLRDMASLACTTALYDTLGPGHPLFQQRYDLIVMHDVPTHIAQPDDRIQPDFFMSLAVTGALRQKFRSIETAMNVPVLHQDEPETTNDGASISLFCVKRGNPAVGTGFMEAEVLIAEYKRFSGRYRDSLCVSTDSEGKLLLHLPEKHVEPALSVAAQDRHPLHTVDYWDNTMAIFRDQRMVHCTDVGYNPITGKTEKRYPSEGRVMKRNIFGGHAEYDFKSNPQTALAGVRRASRHSVGQSFLFS